MNKIMRFYTKAATTPPSPIEVISAPVPPPKLQKYPPSAEFSHIRCSFQRLPQKTIIGEYKRMLPQIGFPPHLARHLIFLTEDILQVVTFWPKAEEPIRALWIHFQRGPPPVWLWPTWVPLWDLRWIHWRISIKSYLCASWNKPPTSWPAK